MIALRCALIVCVCLSTLISSQRVAFTATTAVQAEADAHDHGEESQIEKLANTLGWRTDLAIWTAVVFLVTLIVLWKFAWGLITVGLQKREDSIAENIATAKNAAEEARRLTSEYEAKLASAADEVREMLEEARRDADATRQRIVNKAQEAASEEKSRALREIELAKNQALEKLLQESVNRAFELAGQIVGRDLKTEDHARLIKDTLENLPNQN